MKHICFSILLLLLSCAVFGQETMLGLTRNYNLGSGAVFREGPGIQEVEINDLFSEPLFSSNGKFLLHSSGRIYGVSSFGGARSKGALYSFDQDGDNFKVEYSFGKEEAGTLPKGGLTEGTNGLIYGILGTDAIHSIGTVYRYDPSSGKLSNVYEYSASEAAGTHATLLAASEQWLYGTSPYGGDPCAGTIVRIAEEEDRLEVLYEFSKSTAYQPSPFLSLRSDGMMYGYCQRRPDMGNQSVASLFRIHARSGDMEFLQPFPEPIVPVGELLVDQQGYVYGVSQIGGAYDEGMIFKTDSLGQRFVRLYSFGEPGENFSGSTSLTLGDDGLLYGYCLGEAGQQGGLFRINTYGDDFQLISRFQPTESSLIQPHLLKTNSQFIGVRSFTKSWYAQGNDFVFVLEANGEAGHDVINTQHHTGKGVNPVPGLILGAGNAVYGMTKEGGANDLGVLFRTDYCGNNYRVLLDFDEDVRITHIESLLEGPDGNLLAAVQGGGNFGKGRIIRISPDSGYLTDVFHFEDSLLGEAEAKIILHPNQYIYGIGNRRMQNSRDTIEQGIFRVRPDGSEFSIVKKWVVHAGLPSLLGDLMVHSNGRIYGSLRQSVFEFDPETEDFSLRPFELDEDEDLNSLRIIEGPDHRLYGTGRGYVDIPLDATYYFYPFVWVMDPDTGAVSFHSQVPIWGQHPIIDAQLTRGPDNRIYGIAWMNNYPGLVAEAYEGFVFSVDTTGSLYTREIDFDETVGYFPIGNVLFAPDGECPPIEAPILQDESSLDDTLPPGIYPNPVSEFLHIITEAETSGAVSIRDLQGRILGTYFLDPQTGSTSIDMRSYASGAYLLTISNEENTSTYKVVKW